MYVAASCSFVNQQTVAAGGDVVAYVMTVAGDGCKHFLIGVVAHVCERWEVSRYKTTTVTTADERCKSLAVGCTSEAPPGAEGIH